MSTQIMKTFGFVMLIVIFSILDSIVKDVLSFKATSEVAFGVSTFNMYTMTKGAVLALLIIKILKKE